jgi:hypothetical protein
VAGIVRELEIPRPFWPRLSTIETDGRPKDGFVTKTGTKALALFVFVGAAAAVYGQSTALPDCREAKLAVGEKCVYRYTELPTQVYLGDISLPSSDHVHVTGPFGVTPLIPAAPQNHFSFDAGALGSIQTETLGYKRYVSDGFKVFGTKQWSDWRGLAARGTVIRYDLGKVGQYAGDNHTEAAAFGPRIQHSFRAVTPYAEALIGALHQYSWGMSESGVVGAEVQLSRRLSLVPAEAEYRYATFQYSSRLVNPRRGRIEVASGLVFHFGGAKS